MNTEFPLGKQTGLITLNLNSQFSFCFSKFLIYSVIASYYQLSSSSFPLFQIWTKNGTAASVYTQMWYFFSLNNHMLY